MSDPGIRAVIQAFKDTGVVAEQHSHVSTDVHRRNPEPSIAEMRAEMRQMKQQIEQQSQHHSAMCMNLASLRSDVHTIRTDMAAFKTDVMSHLKVKYEGCSLGSETELC